MRMRAYRVTLEVTAELPADPTERREAYDVTDPTECIALDVEYEPMAWFSGTSDVRIVAVVEL